MEFVYDDRGRLVETTSALGTSNYEYGDNGLPVRITNPLGEIAQIAYDAAERPVALNTAGVTVELGYDSNGAVTSIKPPGKPSHISSYAPGNLLMSYQPPGGAAAEFRTDYSYNSFGDLVSSTDPTQSPVLTTYDDAGRVSSIAHAMDEVRYQYVSGTQQVQVVSSDEVLVSYGYDGALQTELEYSGAVAGLVEFETNDDLRVSALSYGGASVGFAYDLDGLLTQIGPLTFQRDMQTGRISSSQLAVVEDDRLYDDAGLLAAYSAFTDAPLYQRTEEHDALGRVTGRDELVLADAARYDYTYDAQGRLISVRKDGSVQEEYSYDENGNRIAAVTALGSVTAEYDAQDRLLRYGSVSYSYTPAGDLTSRNAAGDTTAYVYDRRGNLRRVTLPDGREIEYVIDGLGRRVGKRIDGQLALGLLYKDQLNPVVQLGPDGETVVATFGYGEREHVPDFMHKDGVYYRFITDQVGSVRLVVNANTGEVAQRIDYDSFGVVLNDTNPGFQPFGFAGGLYDPDTGLVRFGARDYDPEVGRWTNKDPIRFYGGDNLYVYVGNSPLAHIDPSGLFDWGRAFACVTAYIACSDPRMRGDTDFHRHCNEATYRCHCQRGYCDSSPELPSSPRWLPDACTGGGGAPGLGCDPPQEDEPCNIFNNNCQCAE